MRRLPILFAVLARVVCGDGGLFSFFGPARRLPRRATHELVELPDRHDLELVNCGAIIVPK